MGGLIISLFLTIALAAQQKRRRRTDAVKEASKYTNLKNIMKSNRRMRRRIVVQEGWWTDSIRWKWNRSKWEFVEADLLLRRLCLLRIKYTESELEEDALISLYSNNQLNNYTYVVVWSDSRSQQKVLEIMDPEYFSFCLCSSNNGE